MKLLTRWHWSAQRKQNLALIALLAYYLAWFLVPLMYHQFFVSLASDYLALWSAGKIAREQGFAQVYRLETLRDVQQALVPNPDPQKLVFYPIPAPYLPFFQLPMLFLSGLPPALSFWIWTFLNFGVLLAYLIHYARRWAPLQKASRPLLFLLFSLPVFGNFFWGQLNVWLLICVGEFLWNLHEGHPWRAGLWLSGLMLKPQTLLLIAPLLLLWRAWKTLAGFLTGTSGILLFSALLLGREGILNFLSLSTFWGNRGNELPALNPSNMMNWRMVAEHLTIWLGKGPAWGIALLGSLVTLWIALRPCLRFPAPRQMPVVFLRIFAATLLVTWHSHYHMAMILLPPLLPALLNGEIPFHRLTRWVFLPPLVQFIALTLSLLFPNTNLFVPYHDLNSLFTGLAMMGTTAAFFWNGSRPAIAQQAVAPGDSG